MKHRGLLHHMDIVVSDLARASAFYAPFFRFLGYELAGESARYQDWRRSDLDTPHEITLLKALPGLAAVSHAKGAVGHHHHIAFAAEDRSDVDRLFREILMPAAERGLCRILDAPVECPEYGRGYYATFFEDPDGLKLEFVIHEAWLEERQGNALGQRPDRLPATATRPAGAGGAPSAAAKP
jgi:catechol 2,3-dioxygenase-like lactoylglutathione lyase family enzyme